MAVLTRSDVIEQLERTLSGSMSSRQLAAWAFDQFYAEEEGTLDFEHGYRRAIGAVLDDLMFSDEPGMALTDEDLRNASTQLQQASFIPNEDDEEENDTDVDTE